MPRPKLREHASRSAIPLSLSPGINLQVWVAEGGTVTLRFKAKGKTTEYVLASTEVGLLNDALIRARLS